jgi:Ca2+-binding EF-hand superfamily protein
MAAAASSGAEKQSDLLADLERYPEVKQAIEKVWALADTDGSGSIETLELEGLCRRLLGETETATVRQNTQRTL